jgi:hypothetical protein
MDMRERGARYGPANEQGTPNALTAVPKSWLSWDFLLQGPMSQAVAEVRISSWRERGSVVVDGVTYLIHRDGLLGPFILEDPEGSIVASATKQSALRREFLVAHGERRYVLKAMSAFRRECGLFHGERRIGSILPDAWWNRRARVQMSEDLAAPLEEFVVWLALLLWQRDAAASGM